MMDVILTTCLTSLCVYVSYPRNNFHAWINDDKMTDLKRAKTWEISDSEDESNHEIRSFSGCDSVRKDNVIPSSVAAGGKSDEQHGVSLETPQASSDAQASTTPTPGRKRRRPREEMGAGKLVSDQKKETREEVRRKRAEEKEARKLEQKLRREAAGRLKRYRPENCLRCFTICVDQVLLQDEGSDTLLGTLNAMEWKSNIEEQLLPRSITWERVLPEGEDEIVQEEQVLMVLKLNEFMDMLVHVKEVKKENVRQAEHKSLFDELSQYLNKYGEKIITLAVIGLSSWALWEEHCRRGQRFLDLEEALVALQLSKNVSVIFMESWQDLTDHVCAITKALSKRPIKLVTEAPDLPFCVDGSWASGVRVKKDGSGLSQVWSRQVQQLNRVSPAVAATITTAFPSPQLLLQAYKDTASEGDRRGMLADLPVRNREKERRVGPEISSRVYRLLSAQNPQLVLD